MEQGNTTYLYNRILRKDAKFNMWFAFPGPKSFALSSLGYLWLYKDIDSMPDVNVEMICSDTVKTKIMRENVDLISFSLSFDMDIFEVLKILDRNCYSFKSCERADSDPLIYAGGPVITSNPQPYKNIFDFMVIGDGEDVNLELIKRIIENKSATKQQKLEILSQIEGIYVPCIPQKTVKKLTKKLSECIYTPIISDEAFFKNTFILEVERGCANRCGFCLASYMNLPIRFPSYEKVIDTIELALKHTNKIALLGAQITAHPDFEKICEYINNKIKSGENIEAGVSSLRVDAFTEKIVSTFVNAGQKNLTLAVEAGSEHLRKVINKHLTEEQIFRAVEVAIKCGLKGIKFYGMIGLPTETDEDIRALVDLAKIIRNTYKNFTISFGFSTFVPKANTPFQWFGRDSVKNLERKSVYLKKEMHKIGIAVTVSSAKWDYYQAVLSRGDEKLTDYIISVYKQGAKLGAFKKSAKDLNINIDYYAQENYDYSKSLPWDFIDTKPGKQFLIDESKRLLSQ